MTSSLPDSSSRAARRLEFPPDQFPPGAPFDKDRVESFATEQCEGRSFTDYVGATSSDSKYDVIPWEPVQGSWDSGDRRIVCELYVSDERLKGSARGTHR